MPDNAHPILSDPHQLRRYLGFLAREWPKLAQTSLIAPEAPARNQSAVLARAIETVADRPGQRLEFGVWRGSSIRACAARQPQHHWTGFDSFEGFPDDGRLDWQKPFKVIQLPDTPANVSLVKGFFSDTLGPYLAHNPGPVVFVNIDCDLYSSTRDVFTALDRAGQLKPGLVISFDELVNYADFLWNESLALFEMLDRAGMGIDWICCDHRLRPLAETARHFHDADHPGWNEDVRAGYWMQAALRLTDRPIDCGPLDDPARLARLDWIAQGMRSQQSRRQAAFAARAGRLDQAEAERERRYRARKALEKQRQLERRQARQSAPGKD